jgi:hypothetical protein
LLPRQVADGIDWPQFVALYLVDEKTDLKPGERKLSEKEFRAALAARRKKREEEAARGKAAGK